jgi:hypothetical protein
MCLLSWNLGMGLSRSVQGLKKNSMGQRPLWKVSTVPDQLVTKRPKMHGRLKNEFITAQPFSMALQLVLQMWYPRFRCSKTTKLLPGENVSNPSNSQVGRQGHVTHNCSSTSGPDSSYIAANTAYEFTDTHNLSRLAQQASHKAEIQLREYMSLISSSYCDSNPIQALPPYFFYVHVNTILPSMLWLSKGSLSI